MRIWKVLLIMAAFMILLPVSLNLLFFTRFSFDMQIGHFSLGGFAVLVYFAIPGIVGMIAGLCALSADKAPSPYKVYSSTGQTFKYGRRQQLELEMANTTQQTPVISPAPSEYAEASIIPVLEAPQQPIVPMVPEQEHTSTEAEIIPREQSHAEATIIQQVEEPSLSASQEEEYITSAPGEEMSAALTSLLKQFSEDKSSEEVAFSISKEDIHRGFEEMMMQENIVSHFPMKEESGDEFFNSSLPFHEYGVITQRYGEEVANKITTTPELGPREFHDIMLIDFMNGEINCGEKRIALTGNVPEGNGVVLVRGQFVSSDTFHVLSWEFIEAVKTVSSPSSIGQYEIAE
ncbi:hypothetical protein P9597_09265 [Aneurinibacillus migulanus]|uniref:hypothetical protein n=1 Tax=Aneurinibacillus migulanus TaxID=47500 RepID=UPI002E20DEEE|nr:hypothetical protein [Aneurinibacillus migulanus]